MRFFDVHTHVQFAAFEPDKEEVVSRALSQNVWMINVGTQKDTSQAAVELAKNYDEGVYATVGLHPNEFEEFDYDFYRKLTRDEKVVGIGECGLDYYRFKNEDSGFKKKQESAFLAQINLAAEIKKPLMIHCRDAFGDLITFLKSKIVNLKSNNPGVIHFFSGTTEDAEKLIDLGFSFSFGGVITFAREYEKLIKFIPLEKILLETDAPYVAPIPYRGKRNEPSYIQEVAQKIAKLKDLSLEEIAATTFQNARKIFLN